MSSVVLFAAGAGAVVSAVGGGVLLARCLRGPRPDLFAWSAVLLGLLASLGAQTLGYLGGYDSAMFRAMELGGQVIAPLALTLAMSEVAGRSLGARFCARAYVFAVAIVAGLIAVRDQLASTAFTKAWPDPKTFYGYPARFALMLVGVVTVVIAAVAVLTVLRRSDKPGWDILGPPQLAAGGAAVLLAYPPLVLLLNSLGHGRSLPVHHVFTVLCTAAAVLTWYAGVRTGRVRIAALRGNMGAERGDDAWPGPQGTGPPSAAGRGRDFYWDRGLSRNSAPDRDLSRNSAPDRGLSRNSARDRGLSRNSAPDRDPSHDFHRDRDPSHDFQRDRDPSRDFHRDRDLGRDFPRERDQDFDRTGDFDPDLVRALGEWDAAGSGQVRDLDQADDLDHTGDLDRYVPGDDAEHGRLTSGDRYRNRSGPGVASQDPDAGTRAGAFDVGPAPERDARPAAEPPRADPFGQIAIYTLLEDRVAEFDQIAERLVDRVKAAEPDTLVFIVHAVPSAPLQRILYEVYRDRKSYEWHRQQRYVAKFEADRRPYVLATNVIELGLQQVKVSPFPAMTELFGEPGYDTAGFQRPGHLSGHGRPSAPDGSARSW